MKTCAIIISHYESLEFLRACIRQIRKYAHPEIKQHIIIADQSNDSTNSIINSEFGGQNDVTISRMKPLYSGYGIDYVMRYVPIDTEYICQLHTDAFPIHKNWLYLCINLIEEYNFSFVGQNHFETNPSQSDYYYLKNMFYSMSPTFNVAKTETYREMALEGGFTRFHERPKIDVPMTFNSNDWAEWAKNNKYKGGSDDDVIAYCWEGNHKETDKLGLPITGMIGIPPGEVGYGRIIDDIVFHFGFCRESIGVAEQMGTRYRAWTNRINKGFDDHLIDDMLLAARANSVIGMPRTIWNGKLRKSFFSSEELNNRIEQLKEL